jgi:hypothetical protein
MLLFFILNGKDMPQSRKDAKLKLKKISVP